MFPDRRRPAASVDRLALFDFDGTLSRHDSLMPFLAQVAGPWRFASGVARLAPTWRDWALGRIDNATAKQRVLHHFLGGMPLGRLSALGEAYALLGLSRQLRGATVAALRRHQGAGDCCVLVSASLDVYLEPWARAQGFDAVLCSSLCTDAAGRVTGELRGANCFGPEKARRVRAWLDGRIPRHITAYGDSRGDREMLAMADEPVRLGRLGRPAPGVGRV